MIATSIPEGPSSPSVLWINQAALLPSDGGGTRHFELGRELVQRGWRVTLMASDLHLHRRIYTRRAGMEVRDVVEESIDGVELRWVWAAPYWKNDWRRAWNWLSFARSVKQACRSIKKPDLVIGSSPQLFAAHAGRAVARRWGVPFVFEVRDLWPESLLAVGGRRGIAYKVLEHVALGLYRDADRILVLAQGSRDYLVQRGIPREKFVHIPNGTDVRAVKPLDNMASRRLSHSGLLIFFYAGAHGPANGLDRVLDAAEILGGDSGVCFKLIGDGPAKAALMESAARRELTHVEFLDPVSKTDLVALLAAADAGLMILRDAPLFSFGVSPNKLFDYLAAALPVICNVPGEVADILAQSGAGIQVADTSGAALAAGIRQFQQLSPEERQRKGMSGRQWVAREHSREVLGERLDRFLSGLLRPTAAS